MNVRKLTKFAVGLVRDIHARQGGVLAMAVAFDARGRREAFAIPDGESEGEAAYLTGLWLRGMGATCYLAFHGAVRAGGAEVPVDARPVDSVALAPGAAMGAWERLGMPSRVVMLAVHGNDGAGRLLVLPDADGSLGDPLDMTGRLETPYAGLLLPVGAPPPSRRLSVPVPGVPDQPGASGLPLARREWPTAARDRPHHASSTTSASSRWLATSTTSTSRIPEPE